MTFKLCKESSLSLHYSLLHSNTFHNYTHYVFWASTLKSYYS